MGLLDYLGMLRTHWLAVVVSTVLGAVVAFAWVSAQPSVYTSTGSAVITAGVAPDLETAELGDRYAKSLVSSYLDVAKSRKVGDYAAEALGVDASGDSLLERVTVTNPADTSSLRISATGPTPESARDLADAWIAGTAAVMDDIETGGDIGASAGVVRLETLDNARLPSSPSSPNVQRAVLMGIFAGLVLGVGVVIVWGALDRRLRRPEDVERNFSLPVLGAIPLDRTFSKAGVSRGGNRSATKEALRTLRTNLQFIDVDNPPRVIVVTSSVPGDGKSTISYKLAEVIAALGRDVILVDADLRRPRIADYLGIEGAVGLTDVLVGRVDVRDVLQPYGDSGHLQVLAAGHLPPNPSELVASEAMQALLYSFPEDTVVLVDSPPLVPVTDAAVLAARTDGALVVARAGKTTVDVLDRALANLDRVEGHPFGVILNAVPRKGGVYRDDYAPEYGEEVESLWRKAPAPEPEQTSEPELDSDLGSEPEPDVDAEPDSDFGSKPDPESDARPESDLDADLESDLERELESELALELELELESEDESEPSSESEDEPEDESETSSKSGPESTKDPQSKSTPKPRPKKSQASGRDGKPPRSVASGSRSGGASADERSEQRRSVSLLSRATPSRFRQLPE